MIEANHLTKVFGDFVAVRDITFTTAPGSVFAILGPNGAGKTTTIRMLTSILKPTSGFATVAGFDVVKDAAKVRASVGVLTEQHGLYERMNALEYLDFFARIYRIPADVRKRRARYLMTRFGLGDDIDRRIGNYSKGMKQKLALVRALLHDPPVLLLDEPTSAMDPQSARLVRDAIAELKVERRSVILTTHNLNEAQQLADQIAIIRHGRIIASGTFEEMARRVAGLPKIEIITGVSMNGTAESLGSLVKVIKAEDRILQFETDDPTAMNPKVVRHLVEAGVDIVSIGRISKSLEDVYLDIVEQDEGLEDKKEGVAHE